MNVPILAEAPPIQNAKGVLRVGQTGVTLETVLWAFVEGSTPEGIVEQFPTLALADVYEVIAYYLRHRDEIDQYLAVRDGIYKEATSQLRREIPETLLQTRLRTRPQR